MSKQSILGQYVRLQQSGESVAAAFLRRVGYADVTDLRMTIARETGTVPPLKQAA